MCASPPSALREPEPTSDGRPTSGLETGSYAATSRVETGAIAPGAVVGRHVVLQKVGAGGMGVVYAAYDPELDRKVALKLLLPGAGGTTGRLRLLREAKAMAQLSHPNVVAIHDVGTVGEQVWLAMEFVQGQTLGKWLKTPRSWREVLDVMLEAGAGLAAAHAAGLLHRDFKPDNVMIGDDGRVCVMDFGLARTQAGPGSLPSEITPPRALAAGITRMDVIVGTPSYMAPEQFANAELTGAADQFAFCVTLWLGLHGERPFDGRTPGEILANVLAGKLRAPPKQRAVPRWLRRACERGLSVEPAQRWPSMGALLATLAKGHARARMHKGLAAMGVLALLAAGADVQRRLDLAQRTTACEASGSEVEIAWSPARERALREAMLATGVSHAAATADKTVPWLDRHATAWREARVEACLDAEVRGRWDSDTLDRSLWCLDERRMQLESLVDALTAADAKVLHAAVTAAAELASVTPCRDERALAALEPPPSEEREEIREVRVDVVRANALQRAGRYPEGLELARRALERAEALQWRPLAAAARLRLGMLLHETGAYAESETTLEEAYFAAADGMAPEVAFEAATALVVTVGVSAMRHADGQRWGRHAALALSDIPDDEGLRRASLLVDLAIIHDQSGAYAQAKALHEEALASFERALGPEHPDVGRSLTNLASVHHAMGEDDEARRLQARALAIFEAALGPAHPYVASSLDNLAVLHYGAGAYDDARALNERALAMREEMLGRDHPDVAASLGNLAMIAYVTGEHDEAKSLFTRAATITEAALGPNHPELAKSLCNLGEIHTATADFDEAKPLYERALAIFERALGPEHRDVAVALSNLAEIHEATGDHERARALHERALAIREQALGGTHPDVARTLLGLARIALHQHRPTEATALARRALTIEEQGVVAPDRMASTQLVLAKAQWEAAAEGAPDRAEAVRRAEQAREAFRAAGKGRVQDLAEVEAWLAAHRIAP